MGKGSTLSRVILMACGMILLLPLAGLAVEEPVESQTELDPFAEV